MAGNSITAGPQLSVTGYPATSTDDVRDQPAETLS
ncbi:hypothetical protein FOCG_07898 [Fusarium oxysporum f. sp. radicis-lycopersici 26381]|uniref:Uncharacterized protein n=1 Tax=Fusarium oxysporum Fo47 TaxID=660027 RepID=W9JN40_FUSOX|nr:hypothetical protein FOZG_15187 [Fusarium oxysporum Fo47]EWZ85046.1 hypothetical protein FOWG_11554 [Fusarium oxysporum f. sp. lycopersici MN25]EXL52080.1 hypothetical protein FOCG_07898 [Fusarium oxysporum f. sp. radicis-lycopersici 26381]